MEHYGIRGRVLKWFKSYLRNGEQFVTINGTNSTNKAIEFGVLQWSILGLLLFINHETIQSMEVLFKFEIILATLVEWVGTNG